MRHSYLRAALAALIAILFACAQEPDREETIPLADTTAADAAPYWGDDPALTMDEIETGRHDSTWLRAALRDTLPLHLAPRERAARLDTLAVDSLPVVTGRSAPFETTASFSETYDDIGGSRASGSSRAPAGSPAPTDSLPSVRLPIGGAAQGPSVLYVQVLLDRSPFRPGILDGKWGKNSSKAVWWLQRAEGLEPTGEVDSLTFRRLVELAGGPAPYLRTVRLEEADVSGPFVEIPGEVQAQAELDCMCYASALEQVAERFHADPALLERLNPGRALDSLAVGDSLVVPAVDDSGEDRVVATRRVATRPDTATNTASAGGDSGVARRTPRAGVAALEDGEIARIVVSIDGFYVHALDAEGRLLHHFPATLGSRYQPSPGGEFRVTSVTFDPWFHWQPALFDEVPDDVPDARIPPGPNSPVGIVWIALSKENYGIHGTNEPATIGYATSHGCVRLTNWDARFLAKRVGPDVPVEFRDAPAAATEFASVAVAR